MSDRPTPAPRAAFRHWLDIPTRWSDFDVYGHVNNVIHYALFDTAVNKYLIETGALDPARGATIGLVVETHCNYFAEMSFPETVEAGLAVGHLGRSSVRYEIGLFRRGEASAAAQGHFVHVYVDRATRRPVRLPEILMGVLAPLVRAP